MGITDIVTDITDIVTNIAGIADRVLQTLQWKQVGAYKVSQGYPMTIPFFIKEGASIIITY